MAANVSQSGVSRPVLKWQYGACFSSWCETGWYSSPAIADLDGNGRAEVVASAYSVVALDGTTGNLLWRANSGHDRSEGKQNNVGRTWPGIVIQDIDDDGNLDIITAHGGGYVSAYNHRGYFKRGWPKHPISRELRGLSVDDIDNDGTHEIVVTGALGSKTNTWVYEHNGALRRGWPQLSNDSGYAWGVFNDNAWIADITGDKQKEIVVPSDVHYISSYTTDGRQLPAHSKYGGKGWGKIGLWEDPGIELRGWGDCSSTRRERYRANLAHSAATVADLDGDGTKEVVATGNMYDCAQGHPPGRYTALFIFNPDRSRFNKNGWNWSQPAMNTGAPLTENYGVIESVMSNPVTVDLDGDDIKEILFSSYDGRMHAFWLNKQERHSWPFSVYNRGEGFMRHASEPVVADLDGDGKAEVIFVSWVQKNSSGPMRLGKLHILNYQGRPLHQIDLPRPKSTSRRSNGALAAPTLGNIDGDPDLEIVINTISAGFVAYDLPNTAGARVLWGSGRNKNAKSFQSTVPPMLHMLLNE